MKKKIKPNKVWLYIYVCLILLLLVSTFFKTEILIYLGEKAFITFHKNEIALSILNRSGDSNNYRANFLLGRIHFVNGNLPQSISEYDKAIKANSNHKESYYGRGLALGFMGENYLSLAKEDFTKYIEIDNKEFEETGYHAYGAWAGYNDLAWIYFMEGDFENSKLWAEKGLEIAPNNPWLNNMMGASLLAMGDCENANKYLESARSVLGNTPIDKFGEAYSGDKPINWESGKNNMQRSIEENLKLCASKSA